MTHDLWSTLNFKMYEYLSSVTLAELVDSQKHKLEASAVPVLEDKRRLGPQPRTIKFGRDKSASIL